MRDLQKYADSCMEKLDSLNIEYADCIQFVVNTRAKNRWGLCKKEESGAYTISINVALLDETNDVVGLEETILHELLHTCYGCMNHGKKWKAYVEKVNRAYGYNISRLSSADEKGVHSREINNIVYRFAIQCEDCGKVYKRSRMSKSVLHPERYRCSICGGRLERIL